MSGPDSYAVVGVIVWLLGNSCSLMQHMFAPVSIVIGKVVLLNLAAIKRASGVELILLIFCSGDAVMEGEQLSAVFNLIFSFLDY